jgi:hypothetical protein
MNLYKVPFNRRVVKIEGGSILVQAPTPREAKLVVADMDPFSFEYERVLEDSIEDHNLDLGPKWIGEPEVVAYED